MKWRRVMSRAMSTILTKLHRWHRYRQTVRELAALSNHQLSDLGLTRGQIESVARRAVQA
ncbi:DUF1127 domain-containing protein [Propylenella binzhouense]